MLLKGEPIVRAETPTTCLHTALTSTGSDILAFSLVARICVARLICLLVAMLACSNNFGEVLN